MSKILTFLLIAFLGFSYSNATVVDVGKVNQFPLDVWYNVIDGNQNGRSATEWDLAFEMEPMRAGIFINDTRGDILYYTGNDWISKLDTAQLASWTKCYNTDSSWHTGAFNRFHDGYDPKFFLDFGWGIYNTNSHKVIGYPNGSPVYVLKYASGKWSKISIIEKDSNFLYKFIIANLDGTDSNYIEIPRNSAKNFSYFINDVSKQDNITLREPDLNQWDLLFSRYTSKVPNPFGPDSLFYTVLGVKQSPFVHSLMLDSVDTGKVNVVPFTQLSAKAGTIGWDWKVLDQSNTFYNIVRNRVYLLQRMDPATRKPVGEMYKLIFDLYDINSGEITFNTSIIKGTGVETILNGQTKLLLINNTIENNSNLQIAISSTKEQSGIVTVFDLLGTPIQTQKVNISENLSSITIQNLNCSSGMYFVKLDLNNGNSLTEKFIVK